MMMYDSIIFRIILYVHSNVYRIVYSHSHARQIHVNKKNSKMWSPSLYCEQSVRDQVKKIDICSMVLIFKMLTHHLKICFWHVVKNQRTISISTNFALPIHELLVELQFHYKDEFNYGVMLFITTTGIKYQFR